MQIRLVGKLQEKRKFRHEGPHPVALLSPSFRDRQRSASVLVHARDISRKRISNFLRRVE